MKLKTKLLLATSLIVLLVLSISEWISYRQMGRFLSDHETRMQSDIGHKHERDLTDLRQKRQDLFWNFATLHTVHATVTILALVLALSALWRRTVLSPLDDLLRHINYMGRGNWATPVPVRSQDEIGELTQAFNDLGENLTLTVQQFASTSKLSVMALLGQSLVKRAITATELLRVSESHLANNHACGETTVEPALQSLRLAIGKLEEIPAVFEAEFQGQLSQHSLPSGGRNGRS